MTYIRLSRGFVFLTAVMDWYSRYILSWEVSVTIDGAFCVSALERALRFHGVPDIFNSDQGGQYTGSAFTDVLKDNCVRISMDGKGRATEIIVIERFWRSLKYEDIYLKDYGTVEELQNALREYFNWYNNLIPPIARRQDARRSLPQQLFQECMTGQPERNQVRLSHLESER